MVEIPGLNSQSQEICNPGILALGLGILKRFILFIWCSGPLWKVYPNCI